jgi:hypothetical protein
MPGFIPWNSQPLEEWTTKYAAGKLIELDGLSTLDFLAPHINASYTAGVTLSN